MRRTLIILTLLLIAWGAPLHGQAPTLGPDEAIGWDYSDADLTAYEVNRFEAQYDGGVWTPVGMVISSQAAGITTFKTTPTQQNGTHTVIIHACNVAGCGAGSSPFGFAVLSAPAAAPGNLHKVPR